MARSKVLDFGIAIVLKPRLLSWSSGQDALEVHAARAPGASQRALAGTIPYMSPEQWGTGEIDERSDTWAVGIILWELCTGEHPLAPATYPRLLEVQDLDTPMPSLAAARPDLGLLADIVDRCLAKRVDERMPSAEALLTALEPLLAERATQADRASATAAAAEPANPYVGLAAFQEGDAARFFGRDRDVASTVGQLRNHCLVTVAGASGAGKSSFIRAGVIPALARSGQRWEWFIVRPSREPLGGLADVLARVEVGRAARMAETTPMPGPGADAAGQATAASDTRGVHIKALRAEPGRLGTALRARCRRRKARILLFVDQFEELYTLGAARAQREAFVRCLEGVADDASSPLRVVLAMRSDFLDRVAEDRTFMGEITRGLSFLPPMQRPELREALVRPLAAAGYQPEDDALIDAMLDALAHARSPLPLLQFTAARLWEARDREGKRIARASYDEFGGVAGALSAHADAVLARLSGREQAVARAVFTSLVTDERTRAIVSLDELRDRTGGTGSAADAADNTADPIVSIVQHLVASRLLLMEKDIDRGVTVEIAHESLIDRWPRLGQWLSEDQEASAFRARLRAAAREWDRHDRSDDLLWRGQAADDARRWLGRLTAREGSDALASRAGLTHRGADITGLVERERAFLRAVVAHAARTRRRRRQLVAAVIASLAAVAVIVSVLAVRASRLAGDNARLAADRAAQAARADQEAEQARESAVQARNASRMASAREHQSSDPTLALALVREIEPADGLPRWRGLARDALYQGLAQVVLEGHERGVTSVAFGPDGTRILTTSGDGTARVWNADGAGTPVVLRGDSERVSCAAFSPDGTRVVTGSHNGTARVWSADGTVQLAILRGHEDAVRSVAFSPDGARVVTASVDSTVRLWHADGTGTLAVLRHPSPVDGAAFSPDGTHVLTRSGDFTVDLAARVWNADGTGRPIVLRHQHYVTSASFSPDGDRVVTTSIDNTARVWRADGWGTPVVLRHQAVVPFAAFSPDGARIVIVAGESVQVWNADGTGAPIVLGRGNEPVAFSPDGARVVAAFNDWTVRVWNADGTGTPLALRGHSGPVLDVAFSPDGTRVVTASSDNTARVWRVDRQDKPLVLPGHENHVLSAFFSPDGARIVTVSADMSVRVWNANGTGTPSVIPGTDLAAFSPDGARLVTASGDTRATARVWNADGTGEPVVLRGHERMIKSVRFSPDSARVVTASFDGTARVWNADGTGEPVVLQGHEGKVESAVFSPDGTRVVTASFDGTARVWNADGAGEPVVLRGHEDRVWSAVFSPDGTRVVTGSKDQTVRMWNADGTGAPITLPALRRWAVFSPDGARILACCAGGTVQIRSVDGTALSDELPAPAVYIPNRESGWGSVFSPDSKRVVIASKDKTIRVWSADGTRELVSLDAPDLTAQSAGFSPDGTRIVTASHEVRDEVTGEITFAAKVWPNLKPLTGLDDPRLWRATSYCPPVALRVELLGVSADQAERDLAGCRRRVFKARARPPASP